MRDIHADRILILDFGSQLTQLIARRVRESGVYCEILPWDLEPAELADFGASGIILSGGPESTTVDAAPAVRRPVLLLYGERDELIPERPVEMLWEALPGHPESRLAVYPEGWHMLLRDLQAQVVLGDIAAWIERPGLTPPSIMVGLATSDFEADR